ncbi:hypothetical protein [Snodgrassella alvi]|uniref:hypothetical protein n=1 Tax=Snodgrassella alvi TaxID=1196083 RepID=UPI0015D56604|nr:hypothetical protein [Snodgrassella alvi]
MSVIRKGDISGDPLLRGLGGSRLLITANDQFVLASTAMLEIRIISPAHRFRPK